MSLHDELSTISRTVLLDAVAFANALLQDKHAVTLACREQQISHDEALNHAELFAGVASGKKRFAETEAETLQRAFAFVAHASNNAHAVSRVRQALVFTTGMSYAYVQFFTELGLTGTTTLKGEAKMALASINIGRALQNEWT